MPCPSLASALQKDVGAEIAESHSQANSLQAVLAVCRKMLDDLQLDQRDICMQDLLCRYDAALKKMFAWYASLPNLSGPVSWEHFSHQSKGMIAGHLVLLLTDFKVSFNFLHII